MSKRSSTKSTRQLTYIRSLYLDDSEWIETQGLLKNGWPFSRICSQSVTRQAILDWLSSLDYEATHRATLEKHVEGTGSWLLHHDIFQAWFSGNDSSMLYCPGWGMPIVIQY